MTLDSHLAGAAARAQTLLQRELPGLELAVHAAAEWGSDDAALDALPAPTSRAATSSSPPCCSWRTISSVLPALQRAATTATRWSAACRPAKSCKLTRIGQFDMSGEARGAIAC